MATATRAATEEAVTLTPAAVFNIARAVWRYVQARKARRRLTHRDDIEAVGRIEDRREEPLPERPTENE
jgi:hypothetical protein